MFWFDFNWQIQHFLNQFWWQINFLLLVILVILGYLSYKKPVYAVGLTIVLLPTYLFRSQIWFLPFTFLELCIWITFIGWLIRKLTVNRQPLTVSGQRLTVYRWPILLILIASTISLFISPNLTAAAGLWKAYFIEPILFFIVLINVIQPAEGEVAPLRLRLSKRDLILWALGISTLTISLLAICQKFTGFGIAEPGWIAATHRRVTSIFTSPNAVGLYLGPIVAIYLAWLFSEIKKINKIILKLLIIIPAVLAIIFTVSQGTWLGLLAAIIFLAYFGWNKKWTTTIVLILIILTLVVPITRNKILPIITFQDPAGQNRLELMQTSRQYLTDNFKNFIFGAGIFGFPQIHEQFRDPLKTEPLLYSHNIFLNFWLDIGLLGLIAFIWLIIKFFKKGFQKITENKWITLGIIAAMITIIVHGLVDVPYFKNDLAVLFWVIIGLLI